MSLNKDSVTTLPTTLSMSAGAGGRTRRGREPAPVLTPEEEVARANETRVLQLLGAAIDILDGGAATGVRGALDPAGAAQARAYLEEALSLDPGNATAKELMGRLPPSG